jgi:hypothetical protein
MKFSVIFGFFLSLSLSPSNADFYLDNCREDYLKWTGYLKIKLSNHEVMCKNICVSSHIHTYYTNVHKFLRIYCYALCTCMMYAGHLNKLFTNYSNYST